jgi:hypothetical protein
VSAVGLGSGKLHAFFDTQFVEQLGTDLIAEGDALAKKISVSNVGAWSTGTPTQWAQDTFAVSKARVYGKLPKPSKAGICALSKSFVTNAESVVALQLSKAGVRLAALLNASVSP